MVTNLKTKETMEKMTTNREINEETMLSPPQLNCYKRNNDDDNHHLQLEQQQHIATTPVKHRCV